MALPAILSALARAIGPRLAAGAAAPVGQAVAGAGARGSAATIMSERVAVAENAKAYTAFLQGAKTAAGTGTSQRTAVAEALSQAANTSAGHGATPPAAPVHHIIPRAAGGSAGGAGGGTVVDMMRNAYGRATEGTHEKAWWYRGATPSFGIDTGATSEFRMAFQSLRDPVFGAAKAFIHLARGTEQLTDTQLAATAHLSRYSADIASAMAKVQQRDIRRDVRTGRDVGMSVSVLAEARSDMMDALAPFKADFTKVVNYSAAALARIVQIIAIIGQWMPNSGIYALESMEAMMRQWNQKFGDKPGFDRAMDDLFRGVKSSVDFPERHGRAPLNQKPHV